LEEERPLKIFLDDFVLDFPAASASEQVLGRINTVDAKASGVVGRLDYPDVPSAIDFVLREMMLEQAVVLD